MNPIRIALAVAAAMFSLNVAAGGDKQHSQSGASGSPSTQQERTGAQSQNTPAGAASGMSAGSGASSTGQSQSDAPAVKTEGNTPSGAVISAERTAEPKSEDPPKQ